jgi:nicotinate-nucleotide adenylyltransferase
MMRMADVKGGIGILGGTFDPVHLGHIEIARAVKNHLQLELVFIVPTYMNPLRMDQAIRAGLNDRLVMAHLATINEQWLMVDSIEIDRGREHTEVSYTIETLHYYWEKFPGSPLVLIVGSDNAAFFRWSRIREFPKYLSMIAVVSRPEYSESMKKDIDTTSEMYPEVAELVEILPIADNPASSTQIRESLRNGIVPLNALDPAVEQYIKKYGLYGIKDKTV